MNRARFGRAMVATMMLVLALLAPAAYADSGIGQGVLHDLWQRISALSKAFTGLAFDGIGSMPDPNGASVPSAPSNVGTKPDPYGTGSVDKAGYMPDPDGSSGTNQMGPGADPFG